MKVAVFGRGKTGSKVVECVGPENIIGPYGRTNQPSVDELRQADVAILFVPGEAVNALIPVLVESKIPCVWAATGFSWPEDIEQTLTENKIKWIYGANFSLGMTLVKQMIKVLAAADSLIKNPTYSMHEIHHTKKVDAPSGTALMWQRWLDSAGEDLEITHERIGDTIGVHEVQVQSHNEKIELRHESLDRSLFADGAFWAAEKLLNDSSLPYGITLFEKLTEEVLKNAINQ